MHEMAFQYQARNIKHNQIGKVVARNTENRPERFAKNPKPYPTKVARNTENAPKSSVSTHTVAFSHYNNISAQLPIDPKSGRLVAGGVKEQAGQCFENIKAILESIDHVMDHVVRITIFAKNLSDIEAAKEVYKTFFPSYVPALTTVAVSGLPMDALVQIDAVVSNGEGTPPE